MHMECIFGALWSTFFPYGSCFPVCLSDYISYNHLYDLVRNWLIHADRQHLISLNTKLDRLIYYSYFLWRSHCFVYLQQRLYSWHEHVLYFICFYTKLIFVLDRRFDPSVLWIEVVLEGKITLGELYILKNGHPQSRKDQLLNSVSKLCKELVLVVLSDTFFLLLMFIPTEILHDKFLSTKQEHAKTWA